MNVLGIVDCSCGMNILGGAGALPGFTTANPFNQDLNTFDDVTFNKVTVDTTVDVFGNLIVRSNEIALARNAGLTNQGVDSCAVGHDAGETNQGTLSTAYGDSAGKNNQGVEACATGHGSGANSQPTGSSFYGTRSGESATGSYNTAVGYESGQTAGPGCTATGELAGNSSTGQGSAFGSGAGQTAQGAGGCAYGFQSARVLQGADACAFGRNAGNPFNQPAGSLCFGADTTALVVNEAVIGITTCPTLRSMDDDVCDLGSPTKRYKTAYLGTSLVMSGPTLGNEVTMVHSEDAPKLFDVSFISTKEYMQCVQKIADAGSVTPATETLVDTTDARGGMTIPANAIQNCRYLHMHFGGTIIRGAGGILSKLRLKMNAVEIAITDFFGLSNNNLLTYEANIYLHTQWDGVSSTFDIIGSGMFKWDDTNVKVASFTVGAVGIDRTVSQSFDLEVEWDTANVGNIVTVNTLFLDRT